MRFRRAKNAIFVLTLTFITGCNSSISFFDEDPFDILQNNKWTWAGDEGNCKIAVQKITKVENNILEFTWFDIKNNKVDSSHQSIISGVNGGYVMFQRESKGGLFDIDQPYWTLILKSEYEFCWRRSDWDPLLCSNSMTRCN